MFRPPYLARIAAGAAVYALEETRKLPATALHLPVAAVSQVFQTTMHVQQFMTSLAVKGDDVLRGLYGPAAVEQPEWVTFDEDIADPIPEPDSSAGAGRFALYSAPEAAGVRPVPAAAGDPAAQSGIVESLDYPALTLAQLRARLRTLSTAELGELLEYEERTLSRAPFLTMLTNRIATAKAK